MNTIFIAVLLMSVTGAMLVLCLSLLRRLTEKHFSAVWHYRTYMLVVLFMLVPVGMAGGKLLASIPGESTQALPNVPVILNEAMTVPQAVISPPPQQATMPPSNTTPVITETAPKAAVTLKTALSYLPYVWLAGVFMFIIWQGFQLVRFKRNIICTGTAVTLPAINGKLYALKNSVVKTPMLVGLFKTYLILPNVEMSERELEVILKHELVHFKRCDLWVKSLALMANAIHWFNPAAYCLTKQIDAYCELSCDERVVADMSMEERQFYGETILNVLSRVVNQHSGVYATLAESKKGIKKRLTHMMSVKKKSKSILFVSVVAVVLLCLTGFAAASVMNIQKDVVPEETQESEETPRSENTGNLPLQTTEQAFDYDAILQGDISAFVGLYSNANGDSVTLKSDGTFNDDHTEDGITYKEIAWDFSKQDDGSYMWGVGLENYDGASTYTVWFYPVGVEVWSYYGDFILTDTTKTRLYLGHDFYPDMTGRIYYLQETPLTPESAEPQLRTETITLEGFDEQIQTKLYNGSSWLLYYDFERYDIVVEGEKTIIKSIDEADIRYAYLSVEHVSDQLLEDELRLRMEEATGQYTEVTQNEFGNGFYAYHDDGKGGLWSIDDYYLNVSLISDANGGCYVLSLWCVMEAAEGHGVRLRHVLDSFTLLAEPVNHDDEFQALFVRNFITAVETKDERIIKKYFEPTFEMVSEDGYMWIDYGSPDYARYSLFAYDSEYTVQLINYNIESDSDTLLHFKGTRTYSDGNGGIVFYNIRITQNGASCVVSSYETDI